MIGIFRVLVVHCAYQQWGGEDSVVAEEIALLESRGHQVGTYFRHNNAIPDLSLVAAARQTLWSSRTTRDMAEEIRRFRPHVIHVHNTLPLISPSVYWAADRAGIPVVQTLHNFRLMCLNALFLRDKEVCEDCIGHVPWRGVARTCYRGSRSASVAMAGMLTLHRVLGTYRGKVARYIALSDFSRAKFIEGGLPAERVVVKPNFADFSEPEDIPRADFLFVGRLSAEKGTTTLVGAMARLPTARLRVAGDGPEAALIEKVCGLTSLGSLSSELVRREMNGALALIVSSICYENFPRTIVEAFACGLPVIASRMGSMAEIVTDGETGLLFEPGNPRDLADKMAWALAHPEEMGEMGRKARAQYEAEFSAEVNYRRLMTIYQEAIDEVRGQRG